MQGDEVRNVFEENQDDIPLTLGEGGRRIGTAKLVNGEIVIAEVSDPDVRKALQGDLSGFSIAPRDPSARYKYTSELPPDLSGKQLEEYRQKLRETNE